MNMHGPFSETDQNQLYCHFIWFGYVLVFLGGTWEDVERWREEGIKGVDLGDGLRWVEMSY